MHTNTNPHSGIILTHIIIHSLGQIANHPQTRIVQSCTITTSPETQSHSPKCNKLAIDKQFVHNHIGLLVDTTDDTKFTTASGSFSSYREHRYPECIVQSSSGVVASLPVLPRRQIPNRPHQHPRANHRNPRRRRRFVRLKLRPAVGSSTLTSTSSSPYDGYVLNRATRQVHFEKGLHRRTLECGNRIVRQSVVDVAAISGKRNIDMNICDA